MSLRKMVKELTGEDPIDMFGGDCENELQDINDPQVDQLVSDDEISDDEANDMGLDLMERETEKCAQEFVASVKRWAEVAHEIMDRKLQTR
jgi:hypothetical protein